jgi:hypothetical protein
MKLKIIIPNEIKVLITPVIRAFDTFEKPSTG